MGDGENSLALSHLPTLMLPAFSKRFFNCVNKISAFYPKQIWKVGVFCFFAGSLPSAHARITLFVVLQPQPAEFITVGRENPMLSNIPDVKLFTNVNYVRTEGPSV